ncbi:MAG: nitrogenase component 1 [Eubacteriales bacterium]|nr:nitrogenase component 1 [Eubacteriales bacterium]
MLKRVMAKETENDFRLMKDVSFPVPFAHGLEYNSPAHGPWNIVHMGMLMPGSHQIYVCGANCVRGVVLTAAEMNAVDRFSTLSIEEEDLFNGNIEENLIEGVLEILDKLPYKPTAVLLFTVCVHHFMGCDIPYIYEELRRRRPDQIFVECYMDPIMQKEGLTPDQKLRYSMLTILPKREEKEKQISILGSDFPLDSDSEIFHMLKEGGWSWKQTPECKDFEEYLSLGESPVDLAVYPLAQYGVKELTKRLEHQYLYLPQSFSYEEIEEQLQLLSVKLEIPMIDLKPYWKKLEEKLVEAKKLIGDTEIAIDMNAFPRYLGLARFLLEHGFHVTRLYGDSISSEEEKDYLWLKEHAPDLRFYPTIQARMRVIYGSYGKKVLGIGQKAAYFTGSPYFVNVVQGGGYYGIQGMIKIMEAMMEAFEEKKDLTTISHKGLGCECVL